MLSKVRCICLTSAHLCSPLPTEDLRSPLPTEDLRSPLPADNLELTSPHRDCDDCSRLEVKRLGGLHVIGTSLHESRRIDMIISFVAEQEGKEILDQHGSWVRDVEMTEKLDYSSAATVIGFSLIVSILRAFSIKTEATRVMVVAPLIAFVTTHILYLIYYQFDYDLNMKVCAIMGVAQRWYSGTTINSAELLWWDLIGTPGKTPPFPLSTSSVRGMKLQAFFDMANEQENHAEMLEGYKAINIPSEDEKNNQSSLNARLEAIAWLQQAFNFPYCIGFVTNNQFPSLPYNSINFYNNMCDFTLASSMEKRWSDGGDCMSQGALQPKIINCGATLTAFGMLLRFVVETMVVSSLIMALRGWGDKVRYTGDDIDEIREE
ncbi:unnamed protein product [Lactuca virosa]|uniref:Post-GPI attachment to proteins factor 3 n=1 Tax=Lactuca virosa TaxID=75947 RepID=A0AAU9N7S0_9ASTR|nr:unnamed protein product [Lactuca virosa]